VRKRTGGLPLNLVGLEAAGLWCYFARALAGPGIDLAADLAQFRTEADEEYLARLDIPGIGRAGDFRAAGILSTQGRLLAHNVGSDFPTDWVRRSAEFAGLAAEIRRTRATDAELLTWLAAEPAGRTSRRRE
jgi:hypothetical protein